MSLEDEILLHRYCYYVLAQPLIPDCVYDKKEREAHAVLPEESVVHKIGSSLPSDYPDHIKQLAKEKVR